MLVGTIDVSHGLLNHLRDRRVLFRQHVEDIEVQQLRSLNYKPHFNLSESDLEQLV